MSDSRSAVLGDIRRALKRGEPTAEQRRVTEMRIAAAKINLLPARGQLASKRLANSRRCAGDEGGVHERIQ